MRDNKLHTPGGMKDFLPSEYAMKMDIIHSIEEIFAQYGYHSTQTPTLEYIEVFEGKGSIEPSQMFKLFNREGEALALRADMTPPIARMAATSFAQEDIPLRLSYTGNSFRNSPSYRGKLKEFTQSGVELIGPCSLDADAEVVVMAIQCLLAVGLTEFRVDIGHAGFLDGILTEAGFDDAVKTRLLSSIANRDYVAVEKYARAAGLPENLESLLADLPLLTGDYAMLEHTLARTQNPGAQNAIRELQSLYALLQAYQVDAYAQFDLGMLGGLDYYTGIVLKGYAYGTGFSVLDGGRYDHLLVQYGKNWPSVGFAIKIDDCLAALRQQTPVSPGHASDTLLVYTDEGCSAAITVGNALRGQGACVENSLLGADWDINLAYAKHHGFGGLLYVTGPDAVILYNLQTGEKQQVSLNDLLS